MNSFEKPIVSVWSGILPDTPPCEVIDLYVSLGYRGFELSREHLKQIALSDDPIGYARRIRNYAADVGFVIPQAHLPMYDLVAGEDFDRNVDILKRNVEILHELGVRYHVMHLGKGLVPAPEALQPILEDLRVRATAALLPAYQGTDAYLCLENLVANMRTSSEVMAVIRRLNTDRLAICYDTGHLNQNHSLQSQAEFVADCGAYIRALHVNDNDGIYERHLTPYGHALDLPAHGTHRIDVDEILRALKGINYSGLFNFELPGERNCPPEVIGLKLAYLLKLGEYMVDRMASM